MPNVSGNAYGLTVLSPIKNGIQDGEVYGDMVRIRLRSLGLDEKSPLAKVPQTYLARLFVLDDVYYQSLPGSDAFTNIWDFLTIFSNRTRKFLFPKEDHLKSKYLVFSSNFHGDLDDYLRNMWNQANEEVRYIWEYCVAFEKVDSADRFIEYIKKCQINVNLFFMGSTDDSLEEQLKSLHLKQQFAKFAVDHQGMDAADLQKAFGAFIERVQPENLQQPTWKPGQSSV